MTDPSYEVNNNLIQSAVLSSIATQCLMDSERWFPGNLTQDVAFLALCMSGEAGEVNNKVKKVVRGSRTLDESRKEIVEEVTDVFIYLMNLVHALGFDLYHEYMKKRVINEGRWGPAARAIPEQRNG